MPFDAMRGARVDELLPQLGILDRFLVGRAPAVLPPLVDPAGDAVLHIDAVGMKLDQARPLSASRPRMAATSSIRLLVVSASAPLSARSLLPIRSSTAQPPGP